MLTCTIDQINAFILFIVCVYLLNNRAGIQYKVEVGMYIQFRFKSACASAQCDQNYFFRLKKHVGPLATHRVPIKDSDQPVQADLSL